MSSERIVRLYRGYACVDYIGEAISILEHSLQAAYLAQQYDSNDTEFMLAALLHDIGHVIGLEAGRSIEMEGCGITDHEHLGADYLEILGFTPRICKLVRSHVSAKRYLCWKYPSYLSDLSDASRTTLKYQGGPMSDSEGKEFELDVDSSAILQLRKFDEQAKDPSAVVPPIETYAALLDQYSNQQIPAL